jgi:hypothetical protein
MSDVTRIHRSRRLLVYTLLVPAFAMWGVMMAGMIYAIGVTLLILACGSSLIELARYAKRKMAGRGRQFSRATIEIRGPVGVTEGSVIHVSAVSRHRKAMPDQARASHLERRAMILAALGCHLSHRPCSMR